MKYYKINRVVIDKEFNKGVSNASGEFVPNGRLYFDRIGKGEIVSDAPLFDYFRLQSFAEMEEWDWKLQDVHGFIGEGSIMTGWFISDRFKVLLERFVLAKDHHFYASKLLYKGSKMDFWVFQYAMNSTQNVDFGKCVYHVKATGETVSDLSGWEDFQSVRRKYRKSVKKNLS
jgi:hypothetical protein